LVKGRADKSENSGKLEFNGLFGGRLAEIAAECGFLEKLPRVETETPFLQLIENANACQELTAHALRRLLSG
jgi:hypothetical protein